MGAGEKDISVRADRVLMHCSAYLFSQFIFERCILYVVVGKVFVLLFLNLDFIVF